MKKPALPKQSELARLAAIVLSKEGVNPGAFNIASHVKHAVNAAALLWLYAGEHCQALMEAENTERLWFISGDSERGIEVRDARQMADLRANPERQPLKIGTSYEDSDVFPWLEKHAPKIDRFKTRTAFIEAVGQAFPEKRGDTDFGETVAPIFLRDFIARRTAKRTEERQARRDRKKTESRKPAADTSLSKPDKAKSAKPQRRTARVPKRTK